MKDLQKLKKQLLMEELHRQGKKPKHLRWLVVGFAVLLLLSAAVLWYRVNLDDILENRYQKGLAHKNAGRYAKSNELLRGLYEDHPTFARAPQALFEVAETEDLYQGEYRAALLTYLLVERDFPDTEQALLAQRQMASFDKYRLDECGQAIAAYQRVLDVSAADGDRMQYEVADCYFRLNNFEQARIEFESLQKKYPESPLNAEVQYRIAVTYALDDQLPEAVAAYRLVVGHWPESDYAVEAQFGLAAVLEEQEELRKALGVLEGLQGVYPNQEALNRKIDKVRERMNKKKKAI